MTDAEVRELILRYDGSDPSYEYPDSDVTSLAQDYLRLKAAVRLVHGEPVHAQGFLAVCKAKEIIAQVAKEPPCP